VQGTAVRERSEDRGVCPNWSARTSCDHRLAQAENGGKNYSITRVVPKVVSNNFFYKVRVLCAFSLNKKK